jgi:pyruvate dehydrogenase E2 component (dihydrolipoamide acetyltransferase)
MPTQVVMPKLSPTMEEGQLARWLKKEGDKVSIGEPLAEIDTDKATMEMQALASGVLRKIIVHEGESVPLGQMIAIIGEPDEDISGMLEKAGAAKPSSPSTSDTGNGTAAQTTTAASALPAEAAENRVPAQSESHASQGLTTAPPPSDSRSDESDGRRIIVSPLAARMAADAGINLRTMQGSGPGGRIVKRDIESAVAASKSQPVAAPASIQVLRPAAPVQLPEIAEASPFRDEPTTEMRRTIARRLVTSIGPVPHFFLTTEIEMDKAAEFRSSLAQIDPNLKVSFNDIVIKVVANSLIKHPAVNASFQDRSIRYYERADIGVAVAVEDGLITPIIRSADKKSIVEIGMEIKEKAERARTRKLRPEEYLGATFSVSNLGMFGIDEFTAIINPPEAAILAVGAIKSIPVVRNNEIVVRQMMHVTMSCDHRVVDGATGAKFLQTVKRTLENPLLLLV